MCFEWPISPMALKLLPHGQLISLVKRQKSNLDRKGERELVRYLQDGSLYRTTEGS